MLASTIFPKYTKKGMHMHFPNRIYGLEFEHGVQECDSSGSFHEEGAANDNFILHPLEDSVFNTTRMRRWHSNGSCSYIDTGGHPEHATAECLSIRDAVLYAKAGDAIMNKIFGRMLPSGNTMHLFKNNLALNEFLVHSMSYGCHENYHTSVQKLPVMRLIPLLITRQIIDGAGWFSKDNYILSQRALVMVRDISSNTLSERGIINDKDGSDTGPTPRHHIICGDSNILEFAMYLKLGTVALTLALIESDKVPQVPCLTPVMTMQLIAQSTDPFLPCIGVAATGQKSAYDVQVMYLEVAQRELESGSFDSEETEAELKHVALCWEQTLNAIYNRDISWMLGRLDHVTKKFLADREVARSKLTDPMEIFLMKKDIDLLYHDITPGSLPYRMNDAWPERRILTDAQIDRAVTEPPKNTRAYMRSRFIRRVIEQNNSAQNILNWEKCGFSGNDGESFYLPDPFQTESPEFEQFLALPPASL